LAGQYVHVRCTHSHADCTAYSTLTSAIVTICVGAEQRLFAGHEEVLRRSPYFEAALKGQFFENSARRVNLPDEQPEVLSAVLEYLYKGDYHPKLLHNKRKDTWELDEEASSSNTTIYHHASKQTLMKDTVV
jgi:hypothetical protein